ITGTDMHEAEAVYAWTTLNVSEFSEEAIFQELKAKRTGYIYDGSASPYDVKHKFNPNYAILFPFIKMAEIFRDVYSSEHFGALLTPIFAYPYLIFFTVEATKIIKMRIGKKNKE
ncbi:MAG: hypothetical protein ACTSPI_17810, partial [Candidatus Heimdallarchaeaceae archaeon]